MEWLVHSMLSNAVAVSFLAALVAILGRSCRRPAWIHGLCLLALLKLVTPPFVPVAMTALWISSKPVPPEVGTARSAPVNDQELEPARALADLDETEDQLQVEAGGGETFADSHPPTTWDWQSPVMSLVFVGALSWWSLAALRIVRFQRVLRDVEPMPEEWQARIGELSMQMALRRPPTLCLVPGEIPPMLWAVGRRPRLLVPRRLWEILSEDQRRSLILHELAHLKRLDHWVRWLELFAVGLYWWHPAVWWLRRALREAEEQCCDAWVVWTMPGEARTYATALVAALEYVSGARTIPAAASVVASATLGNGHVSCLKRRLRMIVRAKTPQRLSLVGRFAFVGLAALLLPLAPSWGQKDEVNSDLTKLNRQLRSADRLLQAERLSIASRGRPAILGLLKPDDDDDKKDGKDKDEKGHPAAERIEKELKDLVEKLGKDVSPVGEQVRKALERAVGEIHRSLTKEGLTTDDVRRAMERSGEELRKSFERGGPVEKEMREATERAQKELQEAMEHGRHEAERLRDEMHKQMDKARENQREAVDELRKRAGNPGESPREPILPRERPRAETQPDDARKGIDRRGSEEPEAMRREIRDLQQRLEAATRRLNELQRRESRRVETPRGAAEPIRPATPAKPAEPAATAHPGQALRARATAHPGHSPRRCPTRARSRRERPTIPRPR